MSSQTPNNPSVNPSPSPNSIYTAPTFLKIARELVRKADRDRQEDRADIVDGVADGRETGVGKSAVGGEIGESAEYLKQKGTGGKGQSGLAEAVRRNSSGVEGGEGESSGGGKGVVTEEKEVTKLEATLTRVKTVERDESRS